MKTNSIMNNKELKLAPWVATKISVKKVLTEKHCGYIALIVSGQFVIDYRTFAHQADMLDFAENCELSCCCANVALSMEHHPSLYRE